MAETPLKRVKKLLIDRDMTFVDLAARVERSYLHTWRVAAWPHEVAAPTRRRIAKALGVPYEEIWPDQASER